MTVNFNGRSLLEDVQFCAQQAVASGSVVQEVKEGASDVKMLEVGDEIQTPEATVRIQRIYVSDVRSPHATTWIEYHYQTSDGKSGTEKNTVENFKKNILGY